MTTGNLLRIHAAALFFLCGCATTHPPLYICHSQESGKESSKPERYLRVTEGASGKADVAAIEPIVPPPSDTAEHHDPYEWMRKQRLRISAQSSPLGELAHALGDKLRFNVAVAPSLVPARISINAQDISLYDLLMTLQAVNFVHADFAGGVLRLIPQEQWFEELLGRIDPAPVRVKYFQTHRVSARQFAEFYCRELASYRGSATAIDDIVVLRDDYDALLRGEGMLSRLEAKELPRASASRDPGDPSLPTSPTPPATSP